jgi:glycosyltransferase involved in cell wall biosynthesis
MVIVGSGPLENSLRGWARAHQRRVSVTGHLPRRAVLEKMGESDLLVLPSYGEGRPNVVLEAITARLPVLATNLPGVKELVEDRLSGLLYNAGDRGSLVRLLEACLSGREPLKRYADEARRRLERQRLTWDRCTEDHLRLYRDLLENR